MKIKKTLADAQKISKRPAVENGAEALAQASSARMFAESITSTLTV